MPLAFGYAVWGTHKPESMAMAQGLLAPVPSVAISSPSVAAPSKGPATSLPTSTSAALLRTHASSSRLHSSLTKMCVSP